MVTTAAFCGVHLFCRSAISFLYETITVDEVVHYKICIITGKVCK